jgi:hypothetical protein
MNIENKALVLDLLEWIGERPRTYAETMAAWRTSCPRLPVWEDALDHGLIACTIDGSTEIVEVTKDGVAFLNAERRTAGVIARR